MTLPSTLDAPFLMPLECMIELPTPPTVNSVRRQHGPGSRVRDKWFVQADMAVMAAGGIRKLTKMPARCEVTIVVDESARIDLDGVTKYLIDWARRLGLIVNDDKRFVRRVVLEWGPVGKGRCRLILRSVA
jgi:Holliday junction resolvase RusA-like endonuclease